MPRHRMSISTLKGTDALSRVTTLSDLFLPLSWKGVHSKKKESAPKWTGVQKVAAVISFILIKALTSLVGRMSECRLGKWSLTGT